VCGLDRHRDGAGPPSDPVDELVSPRRVALRRVRDELAASRAFGVKRSLTDTIYNMNLEHLSGDVETVFETLDDAGVRTAGTTYLMYRGRHRHEAASDTALARIATTVFRHAVYGPREFFYADIFASRRTGCRSQLGLPGVRDQHAGCVGAHLVEHDLFDFLLLSLPTTTRTRTRTGRSRRSRRSPPPTADRARDARGRRPEAFLEDHAVIVCSDHSQSLVEHEVDLLRAFEGSTCCCPADRADEAEIALCPASRSAQVYVLDRERRAELLPRVERTLLGIEGVDLVMRMTGHPDGEAAILRAGPGEEPRELRFAPRGELSDLRGRRWSVEGDRGVLGLDERDGACWTPSATPTRSGVSGTRCAAGRPARCSSRPSRATSSSTGAAPATSAAARTGRCTPTTPTARCCGAAPGLMPPPPAVDAARHRADDRRSLRAGDPAHLAVLTHGRGHEAEPPRHACRRRVVRMDVRREVLDPLVRSQSRTPTAASLA
jgi:hypothetical protein